MDPVHSTVSALDMGRDPPVPQGFASQAFSAFAARVFLVRGQSEKDREERGRSRATTGFQNVRHIIVVDRGIE